MADGDQLGYAEGILEQLRASYEQMSREQLLDLVCHLQKSYVLDQTIPFDFPLPERAEELRADRPDAPDAEEDDPADPPEVRFGRLIEGLKRRTGLPQFSGFALEEGRAVLVVDNQKVTFGERVTVEFVPLRQPPRSAPASAPSAPEPAAAAPPPPSAPAARPAPAPSRPGPARPAPARPAPSRPAPSRPGPSRPGPSRPAAARPAEPPAEGDYDAGAERFRRLDLD